MSDKNILVTGGAGFIGSHTVVELLQQNFQVFVLDNFSNSSPQVLEQIKKITHKEAVLLQGDIRNKNFLQKVFEEHKIDVVIHFAGLKSIGESVSKPLEYYENNIVGSINLLQAMQEANVFQIVFSSSATVYGKPKEIPISENSPIAKAKNPYGQTKIMIENILQDICVAEPRWSVANLRYFNPIGAHKSGLIGENPKGVPNNLVPYITQVAAKKLEQLFVFGNDYPTIDGTGVRDYIHVIDLAKGHLSALEFLQKTNGFHIWNLGTGKGYSVLQLIETFQNVTKEEIPYSFAERRKGDVAEVWANPSKAKKELHWQAELNLEDMLADSWHWQKKLSQGF